MDHLQDQIRVMQVNFHFALFKGLSLLCPKLRVGKVLSVMHFKYIYMYHKMKSNIHL